MKIMMLTAGEGTRLRPYTYKIPKPALPYMGVPIWTYPLGLVRHLNLTDVVFNTYHLPEILKQSILNLKKESWNIHFSEEVGQLRASAGGLFLAKKHFENEEFFLLMNGDEVFLPSTHFHIEEAIQQHLQSQSLATLLVTEHAEVGSRFGGVWADGEGVVKDFGKVPNKSFSNTLKGWHYIGHMILSEKILNEIHSSDPQNILYDILLKLIHQGEKVMIYNSSGLWFETGRLQDYLEAHAEGLKLLAGENDNESADWLKLHLDHFQKTNFDLKKEQAGIQWISKSAQIAPTAQLRGYCVVGPGAQVHGGACIENSVLIENAKVDANTYIQNEIVIKN